MPTVLTKKQKKGEPVRYFIYGFRNTLLQCPNGMPQKTGETCSHNFSIKVLAQMGAVESCTWRYPFDTVVTKKEKQYNNCVN